VTHGGEAGGGGITGALAGDEHHAIFGEGEDGKIFDGAAADEAKVQFFGVERFDLLDGGHIAEGDIDMGQVFAEADDGAGHKLKGVHAEAETQAADLTAGEAAGVSEEIVPIAHEIAGLGLKDAAEGSELGTVAIAHQERAAQVFFEAADLFGEGGLAEVQQFGGATEMGLFGEDEKGADFVDIHNRKLSP